MTIRTKILCGFISIFIIGMILAGTGIVSTKMLTSKSGELRILQDNGTNVSSILNAHYTWRQQLTEAVLFETEFTGSLDPNSCALGKWKNGDAQQKVTDSEVLSLLNQVTEPHSFIHKEAEIIMTMVKNGDSEGAKELLETSILPETAEVISILTKMEERYNTLTDEMSTSINTLGNQTTIIILIFVAVAVVACLLLTVVITSSIMKPLTKITEAAETIAVGDLDVDVSYNVNDQIGLLAKSFQHLIDSTKTQVSITEALASGDLTVEVKARSDKDAMSHSLETMIGNLNLMFREVYSAAAQLSVGAKHVADGSQSLAQGSTEQASAIEQLSASITEISEKTVSNADIAREAAKLSESIKQSAEKGSTQMQHMMQAVEEIAQASQQIEKVIKVIDDIAFQTNILALNAAVEAARAGQHGKGFAVVAEEVRNLAAKSADAAKNTGGLIENSVSKAAFGLEIANETSISLKEIVEGINRSADIVNNIAKSSDEQSSAISQVNIGIDQVAQVIQQTSATAQESAASSEQMSAQSNVLNELVEQFKLRDNGGGKTARLLTETLPQTEPEAINTSSYGLGKY